MSMTKLQEEFNAQLANSRKSIDALNTQLEAKRAEEDKEAKETADDAKIAYMVLSAMSKIRVPEDGKDGKDGKTPPAPKDGKDGNDGMDGYIPIKGIDYFDGKDAPIVVDGYTPKKGKDYDDGYTPIKDKDYFDGKNGADGYTPKKDVDYFDGADGKDGYTPKKGVDYFDGKDGKDGTEYPKPSDGKNGKDGKDAVTPRKGIDYFDGQPGYTPVKGVDYFDGKEGKQGREGKAGKGKEGARGKKGDTGPKGAAGVGIVSVKREDSSLVIKLTDGAVKHIDMPTLPTARSGAALGGAQPADFQRASRVPISATGIVSTNVEDAIVELKGQIVQSSVGNPFDAGTSEAFMFTFNPYDDTHDGGFVYDDATNQLISKTIETSADVVLYSVNFSYNGAQLESKLISDEINNDSVRVDFTYDVNGRLVSKAHTYIA